MAEQFDMFGQGNEGVPARSKRISTVNSRVQSAMSEAEMVAHLIGTGRFRIQERLENRAIATSLRPGYPLKGVILDTETTGLDYRNNEVIEIGAVAFTFDASGNIGDITGVYGGLHQPTVPIPADITALTGITDAMVAGQMIDMAALRILIDPADLVIAHNASFDRPFCEAFSPAFSGKAWACSNSEINWKARGFEGTKLGYIIGQAGYFHEGHRAVDDCFALLEILAGHPIDETRPAFAELYEASQRSLVRIFAEHSPFDMKDHLKSRGYRWSDGSDGRPKSWWIEVREEDLDGELHYLRNEIYRWSEADPPQLFDCL